MAYVAPSLRSTGDIITASIWNSDIYTNEPALALSGMTYRIDGSGAAITTGIKGHVEVPFACTLTQASLYADQSGSIVIDIWKYAGGASYNPPTHPAVADTITSATPLTITTAKYVVDSTMTGWTKAFSKGDQLYFNVNSCTTITWCSVCLQVTM